MTKANKTQFFSIHVSTHGATASIWVVGNGKTVLHRLASQVHGLVPKRAGMFRRQASDIFGLMTAFDHAAQTMSWREKRQVILEFHITPFRVVSEPDD